MEGYVFDGMIKGGANPLLFGFTFKVCGKEIRADYLPDAEPEVKEPGTFYDTFIHNPTKPQPTREEDEDERNFDPEQDRRDGIGRVIKSASSTDEPWNRNWDSGKSNKDKYDDREDDNSNSSGGGSSDYHDYSNNSHDEFGCPTAEFYW